MRPSMPAATALPARAVGIDATVDQESAALAAQGHTCQKTANRAAATPLLRRNDIVFIGISPFRKFRSQLLSGFVSLPDLLRHRTSVAGATSAVELLLPAQSTQRHKPDSQTC